MAFSAKGEGAPVYIYAPTCKGAACTLGWTPRFTPLAQGDGAASSVDGRNIMVPSAGRVTGISPGGTDVPLDDGVIWEPLRGNTGAGWTAMSPPFVIGPNGRIGKLPGEEMGAGGGR